MVVAIDVTTSATKAALPPQGTRMTYPPFPRRPLVPSPPRGMFPSASAGVNRGDRRGGDAASRRFGRGRVRHGRRESRDRRLAAWTGTWRRYGADDHRTG